MGAPASVLQLIEKFRSDQDYYMGADFAEMAVRSEFLNPVLLALGWDPNNPGLSAPDREVVQEASLAMSGHSVAPDYGFRLEKSTKFYLEAKRPQIKIEKDRHPALQIRRYCWTAGLPLGIVTDFQEWAIYDCRAEPKTYDGPSVGRLRYFTFEQLDDQWDDLAAMFGREAVAAGSLSRFAAREDARGTQTVDQAFLAELGQWRGDLAKSIAHRNPGLSAASLNEAVQNLLDRIIFLRIAEARGLEEYGALQQCANSDGIYAELWRLFLRADDRYNSGLFHFEESHGQTDAADRIAPHLDIADRPLKAILTRLYHPHPYEFSVMPADILGRVYEQFLGSQITVDKGVATVELKPEVRKSGGVYYTPGPVVDYIVDKTLGPLLQGSKPADVAKLRIVDPASGSGSFLIAAYQHLIDWYTAHYAGAAPQTRNRYLEGSAADGYRLRTSVRKRILVDNIFGVDVDPQAVEVTKLSLLLKVIEGETQLELSVGRILPDLGRNIVCGNSLLDVDFPMPMSPSPEETRSLNPFSWSQAFPDVFAKGGFDAVIGNPPYLSIDAVWGKKDPRAAYLKDRYRAIYTDKTDLLFYFIAKAVRISKGEIGMIVSRSFLEADKAQKLRTWMSENTRVREVLDFRHATVFPGVGINTAIIRLTGSKAARSATFRRYQATRLPVGYMASYLAGAADFSSVEMSQRSLGSTSWIPAAALDAALIAKLDAAGQQAGTILHVGQGMQTAANDVFSVSEDDVVLVHEAQEAGLLKRRARNSDIRQYAVADNGPLMLYLEDVQSFARLPRSVQAHLRKHREQLEGRAAFQRGDCEWWRYTWPLHKAHAENPRILAPYRAKTNRFAVDRNAAFLGITDTTILYDRGQPEDLRYVVGVLNSSTLIYRFRHIGKLVGGGTWEYFHNTVSKLPIPRRNQGDPLHDRIVDLVRRAERQQDVLITSTIPSELEEATRELANVQSHLDAAVAELFSLTAEERDLVNAVAVDDATT